MLPSMFDKFSMRNCALINWCYIIQFCPRVSLFRGHAIMLSLSNFSSESNRHFIWIRPVRESVLYHEPQQIRGQATGGTGLPLKFELDCNLSLQSSSNHWSPRKPGEVTLFLSSRLTACEQLVSVMVTLRHWQRSFKPPEFRIETSYPLLLHLAYANQFTKNPKACQCL
jgi:hypothetical protein